MLVVATHNLMEGLALPALVEHHRAMRREVGLDLLCVQESRRTPDGVHAKRIAHALGRNFGHVGEDPEYGVSAVFDRDRLALVHHELVPLPRFERMSWFERRFVLDGRPERVCALSLEFEVAGAGPLTVVDAHLDTVGGTAHRQAQMRAVAEHLAARPATGRIVVCGDTNAFSPRRSRQGRVLGQVLEPLDALGLRDVGAEDARPTHFFARQDEPKWTHQIFVALGRLGLDSPQRYDVVCTDLPVTRHGLRSTPESDHDLVWAEIDVGP